MLRKSRKNSRRSFRATGTRKRSREARLATREDLRRMWLPYDLEGLSVSELLPYVSDGIKKITLAVDNGIRRKEILNIDLNEFQSPSSRTYSVPLNTTNWSPDGLKCEVRTPLIILSGDGLGTGVLEGIRVINGQLCHFRLSCPHVWLLNDVVYYQLKVRALNDLNVSEQITCQRLHGLESRETNENLRKVQTRLDDLKQKLQALNQVVDTETYPARPSRPPDAMYG